VSGYRAGLLVFGVAIILAGPASAADDTALHGLIREALQGSPGIRAMAHRTQAAQAALRQARSAYLPRLNASAAYMVTDNAPQAFMMTLNQRRLDMSDPAFNLNAPGDTENIRLSLGVNYRLVDGARAARTGAAGFGEQMAEAQERAARNALVHEVTRGYYQVLEAQAFVTVQAAAQASLEESLRVARERFDSGGAVKTDVLNLEVQAAQASENLIRARNGVLLAIAALNTAIGSEAVPDTGLAVPLMAPEAPAPAGGYASEGRPEYTLGELQVRAATLMLKAARRERGPVLNAFGSMDWDSEDLSDQERSYLAGVALEWEWFSGFEKTAGVAGASAHLQAAEAQFEHTRHALALDLKQAGLTMQEAWARLQVTSRATGSAEEALRITREQYKEGAAAISVLLVAELGLTETRMRDTAAHYDYQIARSNLDRAAGLLSEQFSKETR